MKYKKQNEKIKARDKATYYALMKREPKKRAVVEVDSFMGKC